MNVIRKSQWLITQRHMANRTIDYANLQKVTCLHRLHMRVTPILSFRLCKFPCKT